MNRIAVFCGSSTGSNIIYKEQARLLGKTLAKKGIQVVYGGAKIGLMGALAEGALEANGHVTGIIPEFLMIKEVMHDNLTELIKVESMHERKSLIYNLTDGAIALPGGYGTMDELFEMLTWAQLGLHKKPVGVLNINGFYDDIYRSVEIMVSEGFVKEINRDMLIVSDDIEDLLEQMGTYSAPEEPKWIRKDPDY
jgi:uncharacterized protein (TIGR00730 family)